MDLYFFIHASAKHLKISIYSQTIPNRRYNNQKNLKKTYGKSFYLDNILKQFVSSSSKKLLSTAWNKLTCEKRSKGVTLP